MSKKKKAKPVIHCTLVMAYGQELGSLAPHDIYLFDAVHEPGIDLKHHLRLAFDEWAKTEEGNDYIDNNGTNWGDATEIPEEFLAAQGIYRFENALRGDNKMRRYDIQFHSKLIVDHDESLA